MRYGKRRKGERSKKIRDQRRESRRVIGERRAQREKGVKEIKEIQNTVERRKEESVIKLSAKHFKKLFVHSKMSADRQN